MDQILPPFSLIVTLTIFYIAVSENTRWLEFLNATGRNTEIEGNIEFFDLTFFLGLTSLFGGVFGLVFLASYAVDAGILSAVVLFLILVVSERIYFFIRRKDSYSFLGIMGTIGIWILFPLLIPHTTWFGFW